MRIYLIYFSFILFEQISFGQTDTFSINNTRFQTSIKTKGNGIGTRDTLLVLYRLENGKRKYLLTHYLFAQDADCNNVVTDVGTMTIKNDSIVFTKHYLQTKKRRDPIPEWKKQVYKVTKTGKLILLYNKTKKRNSSWIQAEYNDDHKAN